MLFKKKSSPETALHYLLTIPISCSSSKTYEISQDEIRFFDALADQLTANGLTKQLQVTRMSTGALDVHYGGYPIGKVGLHGKHVYMQILHTLSEETRTGECYHMVEGSTDTLMEAIPMWIRYIRYVMKDK